LISRQESDGLAIVRHHIWASRDSFLFAAAIVLPRATGLLTLPIYTRLLGPEDFGRYELLTSIVVLLYVGCLLGLEFAMSVRFYGQDETERRRDAASALAAAAAASLLTTSVLVSMAAVLGPLVLQSSSGGLPFALVMVAVPFNVVGGVLAMYLRLRFKGLAFFRAMLGGAIGGTTTGLLLVVGAGWGLVGAVLGLALVHVITFLLLAFGVRGLLDPRAADRTTAIRLVRLGAPLVPAGTATWIFAVADRFFVAAFLGFAQLGLYASAARLATVLSLFQFGFHAAWGPVALRWGTTADRDRRYASSLRLVAIVGGAVVGVVSWLAQPLLWLLAGPSYVNASNVVWLLAASVLFSAMFSVAQIGASLAQRGSRVAWATIIAAITNTAANLVLIPSFGYLGAGIATLAAYAVAYAAMYLMSQNATPIAMGAGWATAWALGWTGVAGLSVVVPPSIQPFVGVAVIAAAVATCVVAVAQLAPVIGSGDSAEAREKQRPGEDPAHMKSRS
jgi:O-antigen/teichoic acid export membrane protein